MLGKFTKKHFPVDKTNSFVTIETELQINWAKAHLDKTATKSSTNGIMMIFKIANKLLTKMENSYDDNEYNSLKKQ